MNCPCPSLACGGRARPGQRRAGRGDRHPGDPACCVRLSYTTYFAGLLPYKRTRLRGVMTDRPPESRILTAVDMGLCDDIPLELSRQSINDRGLTSTNGTRDDRNISGYALSASSINRQYAHGTSSRRTGTRPAAAAMSVVCARAPAISPTVCRRSKRRIAGMSIRRE